MATNDCGLSEREVKLMSQSWQCFDENPKINFEKLAGLGGYTNVKSCQNAWAAIKKKLAAVDDKKSATSGSKAIRIPVTATPKKRARGKKAVDEDADADDDESPAKKVKATLKKQAAKPRKKPAKEGSEDEVVKADDENSDADAEADILS